MRLSAVLPACLTALPGFAAAPMPGWSHSGEIHLVTTANGAHLAAGVTLTNFPALVRLDANFFDFTQARPDGADLRVTATDGSALAFAIEHWDAGKRGGAAVWVRVPRLRGEDDQVLRLHWGKADAGPASDEAAVFGAESGFASVWHLDDTVRDVAGTLTSEDKGTEVCDGVVGQARRFPGGKGVFGGDKIPDYPSGAGEHTTSLWFRADKPNVTLIGWGNEGGGRGSKVRMQLRSPPHIHIDSDFSDVDGKQPIPLGEWTHVAHTYTRGEGRIYINGRLDAMDKPLLDIKTPSRLWLGGWYHNYDFVGALDEVRVSRVQRSAEWVRMEYENQKPMQTLGGLVVPAGNDFTVNPSAWEIDENTSALLTATAGGARKLTWLRVNGTNETVLAVDRLSLELGAGRVSADTNVTVRLRGLFADGPKTREVTVRVRNNIPDPVVSVRAPAQWNGRDPIRAEAVLENHAVLSPMRKAGVTTTWTVSGPAATVRRERETLHLDRAQNSGELTVTATMDNGGEKVSASARIRVREPEHDAWVERKPDAAELPVDGQFVPRGDGLTGTLHITGKLETPAKQVFAQVTPDQGEPRTVGVNPGANGDYALAVKLTAGLVHYTVNVGAVRGGKPEIFHTARDIVCGDVYLLNGQSNTVATDWGKEDLPETNTWIRTYGSMGGNPLNGGWGPAIRRSRGDVHAVGYWGFDLAKRIVESQGLPVCILNGAVGGTRVDQHQPNAENPADPATIYGRLLARAQAARLTHGVRGVLWHQGENDQGADGPTGGFGWETYRAYFLDLAAAWKRDYPNIGHYHVFQIWPKSCAMGRDGSDNRLREVQRNLPTAFSNLSVMSTLGIEPPGGCHFPAAGYAQFARLIGPLVERDHYGVKPKGSITAPNLLGAAWTSPARDAIALTFDQPVTWAEAPAGQFLLDGQKGAVTGCTAAGPRVELKLSAPSASKTITYVDGANWNQKTLIRGENGIAALTFCEVVVGEPGHR